MKKIKRIVFTGGPCAGKTSVIDIIQRKYPDKFISVPEAASILYSGGFPKLNDKSSIIHTQRAIYFLLREIEDMYEKAFPDKIQLCDRGSIDGIAYWPWDASQTFLDSVNTTYEDELRRYDVLIYMRVPRNPIFYSLSNTRVEDYKTAIMIDEKTEKAWEKHPFKFIINDEEDFLTKVEKVIEIIKKVCQIEN